MDRRVFMVENRSEISDEARDERNREKLKKGKKEGYSQLSRASSEEELVANKYTSPLRPTPDRLGQELPSKRKEIEEELQKQQSLLAELHEEVAASRKDGTYSATKEQELWEIQMVATQLKRKLKALRQKDNQPKEEDRSSQDEEHGPCVEMFEEKQLLAVQMELKERISAEKEAVLSLENQILAAKSGRMNTDIHQEESSEDICSPELSEEDWKSNYTELLNKRDFLLAEIILERQRCARLRAEIELATIQKGSSINYVSLLVKLHS